MDTVQWQIVGVFHNVRGGGPAARRFPEIDVPFWQSPWPQAGIAVRTQGDPGAMSKSIAAAVHSVDPNLPLANIKTMDQIFEESLLGDQFIAALFGSFAGTALLLASLGIYGVMAFGVAQRTPRDWVANCPRRGQASGSGTNFARRRHFSFRRIRPRPFGAYF